MSTSGTMSQMTFKKRGTVREYLNGLCGDVAYPDVMTNQLNSLVSFLENNPIYKGIQNLQIDLNIIKVADGWFFDIEKKNRERGSLQRFVWCHLTKSLLPL